MSGTTWDVTSTQPTELVEAQAVAAQQAIVNAKRTGNLLLSESEVVDVVRAAAGDELADVVRDNLTTLRVVFKAWLSQR